MPGVTGRGRIPLPNEDERKCPIKKMEGEERKCLIKKGKEGNRKCPIKMVKGREEMPDKEGGRRR